MVAVEPRITPTTAQTRVATRRPSGYHIRFIFAVVADLGRAFDGTEVTLGAVLRKARFWEKHARVPVNDRQHDVINRLLDGFAGKLPTTEVGDAREVLARHRAP
jgi:hypothetical protein